MTVRIIQVPAWLASTNAWIVAPEGTGMALVVDAPPDPELVGRVLVENNLTVAAVLLTHGHIDHSGGAGPLVQATGAVAYAHPDDDFLTLHPEEQLRQWFGMVPAGSFEPPRTFESLSDGQVLDLAGLELEVRHTPGHTPGHCCFYAPSHEMLFSGDQLFAGSVGRTDFDYGSWDDLCGSMRTKVMNLDDAVQVLPGHGPETTIGRERATNPFREFWT